MKFLACITTTCFVPLVLAQGGSSPTAPPAIDARVFTLGKLPGAGSIQDVLVCAGSNEVLWTESIRVNPYDREANEAKRKAGWYASVALNIFAVDSRAVLDAISGAKKQAREKVYETAKSCRAAPESWRD